MKNENLSNHQDSMHYEADSGAEVEKISQYVGENVVFVKPSKVVGKNVVFRNAEKSDAEFILKLRTDPVKGKYLSATAADIDLQSAWLEKYKADDSQVYFIIEDQNGERYGTVRLYDVKGLFAGDHGF